MKLKTLLSSSILVLTLAIHGSTHAAGGGDGREALQALNLRVIPALAPEVQAPRVMTDADTISKSARVLAEEFRRGKIFVYYNEEFLKGIKGITNVDAIDAVLAKGIATATLRHEVLVHSGFAYKLKGVSHEVQNDLHDGFAALVNHHKERVRGVYTRFKGQKQTIFGVLEYLLTEAKCITGALSYVKNVCDSDASYKPLLVELCTIFAKTPCGKNKLPLAHQYAKELLDAMSGAGEKPKEKKKKVAQKKKPPSPEEARAAHGGGMARFVLTGEAAIAFKKQQQEKEEKERQAGLALAAAKKMEEERLAALALAEKQKKKADLAAKKKAKKEKEEAAQRKAEQERLAAAAEKENKKQAEARAFKAFFKPQVPVDRKPLGDLSNQSAFGSSLGSGAGALVGFRSAREFMGEGSKGRSIPALGDKGGGKRSKGFAKGNPLVKEEDERELKRVLSEEDRDGELVSPKSSPHGTPKAKRLKKVVVEGAVDAVDLTVDSEDDE